jgi:hypothetical protein
LKYRLFFVSANREPSAGNKSTAILYKSFNCSLNRLHNDSLK